MSKQWLKSMAPDALEGLLEELVAEAGGEERMAILFNLLQSCLSMAAHGAGIGQGVMQRDGVIGAVAILSFLRERLRADSSSVANGVLHRFYNAAHRQIIAAHRDDAMVRFQEIRASISKVIEKPYSSSFFYNCMQETAMSGAQMRDLLLSGAVRKCVCRMEQSMFVAPNEAGTAKE